MNSTIEELVQSLTLEEKAGLCSGRDFWRTKAVERLGIPAMMMSDGPHGLRAQKPDADPPHGRSVGAGSPGRRGADGAGPRHQHQAQPAVRPQL